MELYAASGAWSHAADALCALWRAAPDAGKVFDLIFALEHRALNAGASDEFMALIDEPLWQVDSEGWH